MNRLFFVLPLFLIFPLGFYFYFFFKHILLFFITDLSLWIKVILVIVTILFVTPATHIFGFWAVIVLHLFAFGLMTDFVVWACGKYIVHQKILMAIYQLGLIPLLCLFIVLGYGYWNMKNVHQVEYTVTTHKNIKQDYRLALITDLHFGNTMNKKELQEYCQKISDLKPDIVLLGGDIVDERSTYQEMLDAFSCLSQIDNQFGIYYVYGNHDQARYLDQPPFSLEQLQQAIEDNDIQILLDTSLRIQDDLTIVGRNDRGLGQRQSSQTLLSDVHHDDFVVMLDHQPVDLKINDQLKCDLQLSGHTHGGQMFPVGLISDILGFGEMNYGYRQMDYMQVIVSSGIAGWGYPLRTGSHSEYVIVDVVKQ